ncbi:MAG: LysR family transcriptional regulator [Holosporales bacterium]|jgi:DNA-binding transcriptional LysR family regulator|nr:LysR family transcriptional regulator [Holosporales bacterium]
METKKLIALLTAVELGSFNKAAEELGYTQSGLTHMMHSLETEIGFPLLLRDHNGVSFTREGKKLEPFLRAVVREGFALSDKIAEIAENVAGKIRIGAYTSIATFFLPKAISIFKEDNPNIEIEIKIGVQEVPQWLEAEEIDIGFVEYELSGRFEWIPFLEDQLYAVIPTSSPLIKYDIIPFDALTEYAVLIPTRNKKNIASAVLQKINIKNKIMVSASSNLSLLAMVGNGLGITLLSKLYEEACPENVSMRPTDPPLFRTLGIILPPQARSNELISSFLSCFKKRMSF